ncbi:MAG: response regulator [Pseudomonadota bacterium]
MAPQTKGSKEVHILLVEDDQLDVTLLKRSFTKEKISNPISVAGDGIEALEMLRDGRVPKPYLILLDINMPRMNGHEFLQEVRQDPELHDAIVFVLTTSNDEEDRFRAYDRNVAGFLVKRNAGPGFLDAIKLIDAYWRVVEFPSYHPG